MEADAWDRGWKEEEEEVSRGWVKPRATSRGGPERTRAAPRGGLRLERTGGDLLSRAVARQVPSALRGLTALFGMGRGVSLSLSRHRKFARRPPWALKTALGLGRSKKIRQALDALVPVC